MRERSGNTPDCGGDGVGVFVPASADRSAGSD